jgi:chromate transporter
MPDIVMHDKPVTAAVTQADALSLVRMAALFLKIGTIGFGGGMAVIALMEDEFVQKTKVIPAEEFLHGVGLAQILGPFAVNTAFFVGYRLHGLTGAAAATVAFLLPSVSMVVLLSFLYFQYHTIPALEGVLRGVGPVVIALILAAAWSMGRKAISGWPAAALFTAGILTGILKVNAVWVLLAAGALGVLLGRKHLVPSGVKENPDEKRKLNLKRLPSIVPPILPIGAVTSTASLGAVGFTFLKVGMVFFGGGFILIPILNHRIVEQLHWLSPREFLDGVAISNLTPGPIAVLATFTGFHLHGVSGALLATVALFTPAVLLMALISVGYERLRSLSRVQDFLSGVGPTVVGLVASAALILWPSAITSWRALLVGTLALVLLVRFKWHPAFVLALGAALARVQ